MSVQDQIDRLTQNVANTYSALAEKGAAMPAAQNSDNLASAVESISTFGLNFTVVGGTTPPASPEENTIWVNTDTEITGWSFSPSTPETPTEGLVWFHTGKYSPAPFNALQQNAVIVQPNSCKQYTAGRWIPKNAQTWQSGEWVPWYTYLFDRGTINEEFTGGVYGTVSGDALAFDRSVTNGQCRTFTTAQAVSVAEFTAVRAIIRSGETSAKVYFRLGLCAKAYDNAAANASTQAYTAIFTADTFDGGEQLVWLDIPANETGQYFVSYGWGVYESGSTTTVTGDLLEWWLE